MQAEKLTGCAVSLGVIYFTLPGYCCCYRMRTMFLQCRFNGRVMDMSVRSHRSRHLKIEKKADDEQSNDSKYFKLFNARNAKIVAAFTISLIFIYHSILWLSYEEDTCIGLLQDGRYQGDHIWQPYGCMLHNYTKTDSRRCMKYMRYWGRHNWIVYIGDERIHQLFSAFKGRFGTEGRQKQEQESLDSESGQLLKNERFKDKDLNLTVEFYWSPHVDDEMKKCLAMFARKPNRPSLFIVGAGLWTINSTKGAESIPAQYGVNVSQLLPYIQQMKDESTVVWLIQPPVDESKLGPNQSHVRNSLLSRYNREAESILSYTAVKLWHSAQMLSAGHKDSVDGVKIGPVALNYDIQVLMNFYCNDRMNYRDATCCSKPEPVTITQTMAGIIALSCCAITVLMALSRCRVSKLAHPVENGVLLAATDDSPAIPSSGAFSTFDAMVCLCKLILLMFFFFACDRGNVFMKENKWFTHFNLFLPIIYLAVLGLFFTEETKQTCFMHREQTEEWKGWMQLAILCYHMTGAGEVLWIYMAIRCLISSYLFLLGYCHFMYFWTTGDFSLKRVFKVLFRYNMLGIILCVTMNRPYQFYYYVPLASYWFLVCYVIMAIPPQVTASSVESNPVNQLILVVKFVVLFTLISVLYLSEVFFEKIFVTRPWKALFVTSDDSIEKWWFRWRIDRYSTAAGMVLGFCVSVLRRYLILTDSQPSNLFSRRLSGLVACCSLIGFCIYGFVMSQCKTKKDCAEFHAYLFFVPVLSYVMLRNVFGCLRSRVSTFFAWFGNIYLELFTAQYHIWLAADSHGVLVLFPRWPVFNVIITSFIVVCVAHEIRLVTLHLIPVVVPDNEPRIILRNVFITLCIFLPMGFLYGLI